ncbi:NMT1-like family protein [uncultured archaeon]|nr:NMT1-like family protein [uncultured archaeon]
MKKYYVLILVLVVFAGFAVYEMSHSKKTIYTVSMTPDEMSAGLKNGSIAGFISWEPYPAKAIFDGYGRSLVNSSEVWANHPSCVLAISEDVKDENAIKALVWAHVKGTRFINDPANREKVLKYGEEFSGLDRDRVSAAMNNTMYIEFPDIEQVKTEIDILDNAGVFKNSITSLGYNSRDDFLANFFIDRYYHEVKDELEKNPEWVPPAANGSIRFGYIEGNIHYLAFYIARKEGYFEKAGLKNFQLTPYRSGRAVTDAFKHREIDAGVLGSAVLLRYRINDNGMVFAVTGVNSGGSSLVVSANSTLNSLDDLNGKRIATPGFGTCQDTIMRKMFAGYEIKTG